MALVRRRRRQFRVRRWLGLAYATPTAVIVIGVFLVPVGLVVWMSMNDWPILGEPTVNAPDNYRNIADNDLFKTAVWFTIKYTVIMTIVLFGVAMGLALLVQNRRRGVGFFRTAFFLPSVVGFATASLLFLGLLSSEIGPLDPLLTKIGAISHPVAWTSESPTTALTSIVVLVTWRFAGFNMLILLTGLQQIPLDLYEAARVDGATPWQSFRAITLPLMRPTIALVLIMMITGSLLAFDQFWIMTRGGPDNSTTSIVLVIVHEAFTSFDLGGAAAISVLVLVALVVVNTVQLTILRRSTR